MQSFPIYMLLAIVYQSLWASYTAAYSGNSPTSLALHIANAVYLVLITVSTAGPDLNLVLALSVPTMVPLLLVAAKASVKYIHKEVNAPQLITTRTTFTPSTSQCTFELLRPMEYTSVQDLLFAPQEVTPLNDDLETEMGRTTAAADASHWEDSIDTFESASVSFSLSLVLKDLHNAPGPHWLPSPPSFENIKASSSVRDIGLGRLRKRELQDVELNMGTIDTGSTLGEGDTIEELKAAVLNQNVQATLHYVSSTTLPGRTPSTPGHASAPSALSIERHSQTSIVVTLDEGDMNDDLKAIVPSQNVQAALPYVSSTTLPGSAPCRAATAPGHVSAPSALFPEGHSQSAPLQPFPSVSSVSAEHSVSLSEVLIHDMTMLINVKPEMADMDSDDFSLVMLNPPVDATLLLEIQEDLSEVQDADFAPLPTCSLSPLVIDPPANTTELCSVTPPTSKKPLEDPFLDVRELDLLLYPIDEEPSWSVTSPVRGFPAPLTLVLPPDFCGDHRDSVLEPRPYGHPAIFSRLGRKERPKPRSQGLLLPGNI